jgi:hypothetical protein
MRQVKARSLAAAWRGLEARRGEDSNLSVDRRGIEASQGLEARRGLLAML